MLIDNIFKDAKKEKVNVFFDMDGTLVEYLLDSNNLRYVSGSNYYSNNRPLKYTLNIAKKLSKNKNISVHILSNCPLNEQIQQKTNWLKRYAPFIKPENIHIICYENLTFKNEEKPELKGRFLKNNFDGEKCYLIEDDLKNIKTTNRMLGDIAYHISTLIK